MSYLLLEFHGTYSVPFLLFFGQLKVPSIQYFTSETSLSKESGKKEAVSMNLYLLISKAMICSSFREIVSNTLTLAFSAFMMRWLSKPRKLCAYIGINLKIKTNIVDINGIVLYLWFFFCKLQLAQSAARNAP